MSRLDELYRQRARLAAEIHREESAFVAAKPVHTAHILAVAANLYGVEVEEVLSASREPRAVKARQAAMWLLRARGLSLPTIGRIMSRDHTTVLYACNRIDADPAVRGLLWPMLPGSEVA